MLAEHRPPRGQRDARPDPHPEEQAIITAAPELADYVVGLKQRSRKVVTLALRQLLRLVLRIPSVAGSLLATNSICGSIHGNRCWGLCARRAVMVSTIWT